MFYGLEEEHTRFRKKKKEKGKKRKKPHCSQKWVGKDEKIS